MPAGVGTLREVRGPAIPSAETMPLAWILRMGTKRRRYREPVPLMIWPIQMAVEIMPSTNTPKPPKNLKAPATTITARIRMAQSGIMSTCLMIVSLAIQARFLALDGDWSSVIFVTCLGDIRLNSAAFRLRAFCLLRLERDVGNESHHGWNRRFERQGRLEASPARLGVAGMPWRCGGQQRLLDDGRPDPAA